MNTSLGFVVAAWLVSTPHAHDPIPFASMDDCHNALRQLATLSRGDNSVSFVRSVCVATGAPEPLPANIPPEALR